MTKEEKRQQWKWHWQGQGHWYTTCVLCESALKGGGWVWVGGLGQWAAGLHERSKVSCQCTLNRKQAVANSTVWAVHRVVASP